MVLSLFFRFIDEEYWTERDSQYQLRSTSYVLIYSIVGKVFMPFFNTDNVSASRADYSVNRCDADVSLSVRGYFRIHRDVVNFFYFLFVRSLFSMIQ